MAAPSTTEVFLRNQIAQSRSELLAFEKQKSHYESKLETYDKETDAANKATESYQQNVSSVHAKLTEINSLIDARNASIPQLENAIRQVAIDTALLAAQLTTPPPVHPQGSVVPNKLPDLVRPVFLGALNENAEDWIISFEQYRTFYNLSTWQAASNELNVCMRGSAWKWFSGKTFVDLNDFYKKLRHEYGEKLQQDKLVKRLVALAPSSTLSEYLRQFRDICKTLDAENTPLVWIRFAFISNVPSSMLNDLTTRIMTVSSVDELFDTVAGFGHVGPTGDIEMNAFPKNEDKPKRTIRDFERKCTCFNCTGFGHMSGECPSKRVKSSSSAGPGDLRDGGSKK
jgi:hypothetical protein